jgi:hypothetical protein
MDLPPDFSDLLAELAHAGAEAVVVGGYAVAFHARPRATKDIDFVLRPSPENLDRVARALDRFGAPGSVVAAIRSMKASDIVYLGQPPLRIDFMIRIDGVDTQSLFDHASKRPGVTIRFESSASTTSSRTSARRAGHKTSST